jgi:4-amino-4-deoxy-L-arabinose transferase-like glycosyltransferase
MTPRAARTALLILLALRLILSLAYSSLNPLGEAPDEADHYAYAAYIGTEVRLPSEPTMTQAKHPPLYHLLAAAVAAPVTPMDFSFLRANPDISVAPGPPPGTSPNFFIHTRLEDWPWQGGPLAMHLGRLVSVLAGLVLVAVTYGLGQQLWPAWPALALAGAAFVAFLPESLFIGGAMSNDMLAAALSALALWSGLGGTTGELAPACDPARLDDHSSAARQRRTVKKSATLWAVLAGIFLGLSFLTKVSTVALWPVVILAMLLDGYAAGQRNARLLARPVVTLLIGLVVAAPWLWRNWSLFGDPLGTKFMLATVDRRQGPLGLIDLLWLARGWFFSFWGKFGGAGHIPLPWPFYALWAVLLVATAAGWARWFVVAQHCNDGLASETRPAGHLMLWASPVLTALAIVSYSAQALGTDQGRLLYPALAPIGLLMVAGLSAWVPAQRPALLPGVVVLGMGGIALLALFLGIWLPFSPVFVLRPTEIRAAQPLDLVFGNNLQLTGLRWGTGEETLNQTRKPSDESQVPRATANILTLYWQVRAPVTDDLRVVLRATTADGRLLWEKKRSPGAGRYSTDRWSAGRPVADVYAFPAGLLEQAARVEVAAQAFGAKDWLAAEPGSKGPYQPLPLPGATP